jgi:hypothetical protein
MRIGWKRKCNPARDRQMWALPSVSSLLCRLSLVRLIAQHCRLDVKHDAFDSFVEILVSS